jgi:(p)ppGpp synthase/HD superfamily hydrolase
MTAQFDQKYRYISDNLIRAFEFASLAHAQQTRKDQRTPYISHPAGVAYILGQLGFAEEVVIAGLLHDVIEDTKYGYEDIEKQFGKAVADLVQHVTIPAGLEHSEGKRAYLDHLAVAPKEACAISAADLLYNRADNLLALEQGRDSWRKFPELPKILLDLDAERIAIIKKALADHPLVADLERQHQLLKDYYNV